LRGATTLREIAQQQAAYGDIVGAITTANQLQDDYHKSQALIEIAKQLAVIPVGQIVDISRLFARLTLKAGTS